VQTRTLSQKSATVTENGETTARFGDCRTFLRQSHFSATNCRTFLRQCGQAFTDSILTIDEHEHVYL